MILKKLLAAVIYLQSQQIVHRDIKLENIMIYEDDEQLPQIKLIDFGCAKLYQPGEIMTNCCGSKFYIAPEVWYNHYTNQCDVWSIGIITFALLTGGFPFDDADDDKIEEKILNKKLKFKRKDRKIVTKPFRKLVRGML